MKKLLSVLLATLALLGVLAIGVSAATSAMENSSGVSVGFGAVLLIWGWPKNQTGAALGDQDVTLWYTTGDSLYIIEPPGWYSKEAVLDGDRVVFPEGSIGNIDPEKLYRLIEPVTMGDIWQSEPNMGHGAGGSVFVTPNGMLPSYAFYATGWGSGGGVFSWHRSTYFRNDCRDIAFSPDITVDYYEQGSNVRIATAEGRLEPDRNSNSNDKNFVFKLHNNYPYDIKWHVDYDKTSEGYKQRLEAIMHLTDTEGNAWRTDRYLDGTSPQELVKAKTGTTKWWNNASPFVQWLLRIFLFGWLWMK